jgi:fructose-bisphosphate aldolase, class II
MLPGMSSFSVCCFPQLEAVKHQVTGGIKEMKSIGEIMKRANELGIIIPAFNVPYLPMVEPVVRAIVDMDSFGLIESARPEWIKFEAKGPRYVKEEFDKWAELENVRLHLDHVPVIDEDHELVDYLPIIQEALDLGFESVMVDGSRLSLEDNIEATRKVVEIAHKKGVPVEAELGAVLGHEAGPLPPYEELFASGKGFTDVDEAERFARESGCDWLSVAIGNIHGAISGAAKDEKKVEARLNLDHLQKLHQVTGVPLVLHGGSGVRKEDVLAATKKGISKINIGTEIRHAYEKTLQDTGSVPKAQEATYDRTCWVIRDYFGINGKQSLLVD